MAELKWFVNLDQTGDYDTRRGTYRSSPQHLGETLGEIAAVLAGEKSPLHLVVFAHGGLNDEASGVRTNQAFQERVVDRMRPADGGRARLFSVLWENGLVDVLTYLASNSRVAALVTEAAERVTALDGPPVLEARSLVRLPGGDTRPRRYALYTASIGDQLHLVRPLGFAPSPVVTEVFPAPSSPVLHDLARSILREAPSDPIDRFIVREFARQREPAAALGQEVALPDSVAAVVRDPAGFTSSGGITVPLSTDEGVAALASWLQGALDHAVATVRRGWAGAGAGVESGALELRRRVATELMRALGLAALASEAWDVIRGMSQRTFSGARSAGWRADDGLSGLMPGRRLLGGLLELKKTHPDQLKISLVGHSAGTILHGHLLEAADTLRRDMDLEEPVFEHVVFLAAAITYTDFEHHVLAHRHLFRHFLALGLEDRYERDSGEFLSGVYPATLLYLISEVLDEGEQLVGMQTAFADPSRHPAAKRYLHSRVIWTPEAGISDQRRHGGFPTERVTAAYLAWTLSH